MTVAANVAIPQGTHNVLTYVPWAIFHATPVLILLGGLILFDIVTIKSGVIKRDRKEWKMVAVFLAASAFCMLPTRPVAHTTAPRPAGVNTNGPTVTQESDGRSNAPPLYYVGPMQMPSSSDGGANQIGNNPSDVNESTQTQDMPINIDTSKPLSAVSE